MKRNIVILTVLLAATTAYTFYEGRFIKPEAQIHEQVSAGSFVKARIFTYKDMQGRSRSLKELDGKAVVLNFWASWCAPCVIEFPQMVKLAAENEDAIFLFLTWDEEMKDVERFLEKYAEDLPDNVMIGFDEGRTIGADYGTKQIPETYLIDTKLQISGKIIGADVDWTGPVMQEKISRLQKP